MATLDAPKVLLLTNKTKLTLTVTLTLTDTVMQKIITKLTLTLLLFFYYGLDVPGFSIVINKLNLNSIIQVDPNRSTNPNRHSNGDIFNVHFVDTDKKVVSQYVYIVYIYCLYCETAYLGLLSEDGPGWSIPRLWHFLGCVCVCLSFFFE